MSANGDLLDAMQPASREYAYEVTVPAETPITAPYSQETRFNAGELVQLEIIIPDGAAALCGVAIASSGTQIIPIVKGQYFVGNGEPIVRQLEGYPNSGDYSVVGYNTDIHNHTFQVRYSVKEIPVKAPAASAAASPLALSESGEIQTTKTSSESPEDTETPVEGTTEESSSEQTSTPGGEVEAPPVTEPEAPPVEEPAAEEPAPEAVKPEPEFGGDESGIEGISEVPEVEGEAPELAEGENAGDLPKVTGEKGQPKSAATRHKPKPKAKKKTTRKKAVKRKKPAKKPRKAPKRKATHKKLASHKRKAPATKPKAKAAPKRTAPHATPHAAHATARRAPTAHKPAAAKPKPKPPPRKPPPPPRKPPPAPKPPPKRAAAKPPPKRKK